jgi:hypothetical protein
MNKLCAITGQNVNKLRIPESAKNYQQRSTGAPQLWGNEKVAQSSGMKGNSGLSRNWRSLIYYY